ncbi:MAG: hypothetical protein H5T45_06055 [Thermoplasmatales archaeon]|jgi:hypothetical protein|nr:hypothetical protein [Thermoplasmatales archaeon]
MDDELELQLKETIENLEIVDTVVLDFQEKLDGNSAIIISIDKINNIQPYLDKQGNLIEYQATIFGIWKSDDNPSEIIEQRNHAIRELLSTFIKTRLGNSEVTVTSCDKNVWRDRTNDTRYYFAFQMTLKIKKIII